MSELRDEAPNELLEHPSAIAIIGMAGKFPGAPDVATFWQNLIAGKDTITRFGIADEHAATQANSHDFVGARGVLEDAGLFDAEFFGIVPREAARMDPQHRIFLEACYHTLEDAGYAPSQYAGEIGLFAGCALNTYLLANLCKDRDFIDDFTANYQVGEYQILTGNDKDFLTTRVAYKLNLRGPVMTVQSACATSLVAVCQASQALLNFQCDMALAGGVSVTFPQMRGHIQQEGGLASRDGFCRPFDADAAGTVFGHGAGVVLLKRLEDAVRDGDHIDAVIRGFAVNNDGSQKAGYMAPGVDGQARVVAAAQAMAGVSADTITYIEAHGTGTPLGDPIEVAALTKAFRATTDRRNFCVLGAAKGNIGHLDAAAGVTGLIKTVLSLQQKTIPGLAHFAKPNPELQIESSPFVLSAETQSWESASPRRAGVSAFGVGGVNAHVVLEEAPHVESKSTASREEILCLSARSQNSLRAVANNLATRMETDPSLNFADVAYTLACGREAFDYRATITASDRETAVQKLKAAAARENSATAQNRRVAFLFPGQGAQDVGMGKALYDNEPAFREVVDECARLAEPSLGLDLRELIFAEPSDASRARLQETQYAQPALFTIEYALAKLWQIWGVDAEASVGHSLGEYVAATLSSVFKLEDAVRLVCLRGKLMQQMQPGAMIAVPLGEAGLAKYVQAGLDVAGLNSPRTSVLSGPTEAIDLAEKALNADGIVARRLRTSHAFHSAMMEPMLEAFEVGFAGIELKTPIRPFVSTVTGTWITDEQAISVRFWVEQVRKPVRFADAVATLQNSGVNLFVEAGPGETLTKLAMHQRQGNSTVKDFRAVASLPLKREDAPTPSLRDVMAELWQLGAEIDWNTWFAERSCKRVSLPTYPFERKLHWIEPPAVRASGSNESLFQEQTVLTSSTTQVEPQPSSSLNAPSRIATLRVKVSEILGELSGVDLKPGDAETSFLELGFDSLFLTQATLALQRAFGVKVTFRQMMEQFPCVAKLSEHLDKILPADVPPTAVPVTSAASVVNVQTVAAQAANSAPTGSLETLFAQQLATMHSVFQAQVAALQGANIVASGPAVHNIEPAVAIPQPAAASSGAPAEEAEKHGTFQPAQRTSHELDTLQKQYLQQLSALTITKTPTSKSLTQQGRLRLADPRAVAGFRPQWKEMVYPIITDRAKGSRLWDVDGNEYIDVVNGFGCILFGHSPDFVVEAIQKQLLTGVAIGPQTALAIEVAELICELTGNERATFCNTGSEAVMAAIRVARTVTGRDKFVYFTGDYHGTFDEVLVRKTPRGSGPLAPGIPPENTKNVVVLDYGTEASLEYIRNHASELAAVLIEPVQTRHPGNKPFEFIRAIREITAKSGIAMILDEVVTGFRLAPGGIQEMLSIRAEMCTYGKVIGGGHPIGVLSGKAEYLDALDGGAWQFGDDSAPEVGVTFFAGTFVRHPLAMAAARAVLQHLKSKGTELQRELNRRTAILAESLDQFFQERGVPSRVHHFASWFYFTFPGDAKLASLFYYALRAKGIHIQEGYPCFLTTAHSDTDLQRIEQAFRETIVEMQAAHALPGSMEAPTKTFNEIVPVREPALHALALRHSPEKVKLTESQREIFLAAALNDEANCAFNESLTVRLKGKVRLSDLRFALEAVISRHDALRSVVCEDGDCLCIDPVYRGEIEIIDLSSEPASLRKSIVAERTAAEGAKPFDLHEGPLVRSVCFLNGSEEVVLLITAHHLVLDGWSANQLLEEMSVVYSNGAGALTQLAPLLPFSSFASREVTREGNGEFAANEAFWVQKYQGRSPRLDLPTDRPRPATKTYTGATLEGSLGTEVRDRVRKFSAKQACSPFVVLLSSFELLMHRLTRQDEVVVGISTAAQSLLEDASLVGHCVNFLPMLSEIFGTQTLEQHVQATRTALFDAQDHQEFTYGSLLRKLTLEREPNRLPLIEVQFNFERVGENVHFDGLEAEIRPNAKRFVNTDLFLNVVESADGLTFTCDFNTDLFAETTIQRWMGYWQRLLEAMTSEPTAPILDIKLLSEAEEQMLQKDWNDTAIDFGAFEALPSAVLHHAAKTPGRIAIECAGRQWTYAELAEYATIISRRLLHEGLKPGELVGICLERSLEMAGALLAVMMAGGAYVPLDPKHPRERLATIISDARISLLLTGRDPSVDTNAKILDITGPQPQYTVAVPAAITPHDLAYVIYTSGSTGVPKGVAIEHFALMNLLRSMQREPGLTSKDVFVAITTLAFDIAALEIFLPLLTGARLVIASDEEVTNGGLLLRLLQDSSATVMQATPGAWRILLDAGWSAAVPLKVLCGGEALPRDLAEKLLARSTDVWNVYGPTETTIWSSATRVTPKTGSLRLGMPIANTQFYILDEQLRPAPIGVTGELCIGGDGLARGYWNRAELTAQQFVVTDFGWGRARIYRTGDLGRRHADGSIELLGRKDFQVKIRGYRIELGEIESALASHPGVREAVVLEYRSQGAVSSQLVAFVDFGATLDSEAREKVIASLRATVERTLPAYMVPQLVVPLSELPRLPNTKVDRKALQRMAAEPAGTNTATRTITLPVTEQERQMAAIWAEVLGIAQVSTTDSIFELGADSLAIFRIAARAQKEGVPLKATKIFENRTIAAICSELYGKKPEAVTRTTTRPRIGAAPRASYRLTRSN